MNQILCRCIRNAALAAVLCLCAGHVVAQAADKDWQALMEQHRVFMQQGQYERGLEKAKKALEFAEVKLGRDGPYVAFSLLVLADAYTIFTQNEKALPLQQRALAICENVFGPEHPDTALSANYLAMTYERLAQYNNALPLFQRALAIREKTLGPEHPDTATSLNNLAVTYKDLAQYEKALLLGQRALAIRENALGPEHPDTATSLNNLAEVYRVMAQYDKTLPLLQRALAIREKALGPEHPDTATSLNNLAEVYRVMAQYGKALPLFQRALAISEQVLGPEHLNTALGLNNIAMTFEDMAEFEKALPFFQRALAIREKAFGPEHPETALSVGNLAAIYGDMGQYDKALPLFERALAIYEKVLGLDHTNTAVGLNNLAMAFKRMGQYHKALPLFERALAINEQILGPEHPDTAVGLNNLAAVLSDLGQYEKALPLDQRALVIREKSLGPEHPDTAASLNNLAMTYRGLAQYDKTLPLLQRALAIYEKVFGTQHTNIAVGLSNVALTYGNLAQYEKALPLDQRALVIREKSLGPAHPDTAQSLNALAITYFRTGQPDLAIAVLKTAINAYQAQREQVSRIGSSELRSYTDTVSHVYQNLAAALTEQGRLPEAQMVLDMLKEDELFDFIRRSASADPRRTRIGYNVTEQIWMTRYRQIADHLAALGAEEQTLQKQAKLGLSGEQKQRQQALAADLRVAQAAFESFLNEMQESFARQGPARAADVDETSQQALRELQTLLKGLSNDVALLQYYVTEDKVGMLLTTSGAQLDRSTKVSAKELSRQIAEFRRLVRDPKANPLPAAQALYQLLVAPIAQDLEQARAKTVMLSLVGALRYLPFAALHDGQRYLVQRWNLPMYTSVTKNRLRDAVMPQWQAAGLGVTRALGEFPALPAVKAEMSGIVKAAGGGVLPGEVYLDQAFTAVRLKDVSQRPFQLLHVASHFRFSPGTEINSFLLLGDGQQLTLGDIRTQNFRFDNVDLLTLSACDTGLGGGRDENGREIEGFGVIAQQQGAKAVLATLWPVADQSTATLMAEMYRRRQDQHLTKIEALRQAQLSLLAQPRYAHPFYWAPFILMGNWK